MNLSYDEEPTVETLACDGCGRDYTLVKAWVGDEDAVTACVVVACHVHDSVREAWFDVILGTFGEGDFSDHVTFGCRVGPVLGQDTPASTVVEAAAPYEDGGIWGLKLSREAALAHDRVADFWEVADFVLMTNPVVHEHVYGHASEERRSWRPWRRGDR